MKRFVGVMLTLVIVLGMVNAYAATSRTEEAVLLKYMLFLMDDAEGSIAKYLFFMNGDYPDLKISVEYSGVVYDPVRDLMVVTVSYCSIPHFLSTEEVHKNTNKVYELFDTMGVVFSGTMITDCKISLNVKEMDTKLWIIDKDGIYDCVIGEVIDQR